MNEENYILFDQYLQDELSVAEKQAFEKQLLENQELVLAFQNFKEVQAQLENKFRFETEKNAFKENVEAIATAHFNAKKPKVVNLKPLIYLAAASVMLLLGLFLFNPSSKPHFEDFNQHESAHFTERGASVDNLKKAEEAFNAKHYKEAVPLFESILEDKKTVEIQYFYGISLLETNKTTEAEVIFKELQSGNSSYKNKAIWGLALAKLKQKEYNSCKNLLLTIPSDYENYEQVQKLLKELE